MPIDGTWYNELGSTMNITSDGTTITGTYVTPVGEANGTYNLIGYVNNDTDPAVGWVVLWSNNAGGDTNSLTTWCGQYFSDDTAGETIIAMWLLRSELAETSNWAATQVGEDVFFRTPQQAASRPGVSRLRAPSHPATTT